MGKRERISYILVITAVCIASCQKADIGEPSNVISAYIQDSDSKTALNPSGKDVTWKAGDDFRAVKGSNAVVYTLAEGAGTKLGKFSTTSSVSMGDGYAIFPNSGNNVVQYTNTALQQQYEGDISNSRLLPMVGKFNTDGSIVTFKHVFGIVRVKVSGTSDKKVQKVEIKPNAYASQGDALYRTFELQNGEVVFSNKLTSVGYGSYSKQINKSAAEGFTIDIVCPPFDGTKGTDDTGVKLVLTATDNTTIKTYVFVQKVNPFKVEAGKITTVNITNN